MKLALGTAQFGSDYGISNRAGKVSLEEAARILEEAGRCGIQAIDTAKLYGESEEMLGKLLPERHGFHIITKTPQFNKPSISKEDAQFLVASFLESLEKLGQKSLYGLLIHQADDLLAENSSFLMDALMELKQKGLVKKIGVSVYDAGQIDRILSRFEIDLIQLPVSLIDQRLIAGGHLIKLKQRGIEIHARSVFLQGILLMNLEELPSYFGPLKETLKKYWLFLENEKISSFQGPLKFVSQQKEIDCAVVGLTSRNELAQIVEAFRHLPERDFDFKPFACQKKELINPALWQVAV